MLLSDGSRWVVPPKPSYIKKAPLVIVLHAVNPWKPHGYQEDRIWNFHAKETDTDFLKHCCVLSLEVCSVKINICNSSFEVPYDV